MAKESKVKKIIIELSGKEVTLTLAQAKELQASLNELFEERVKVVKEKEYIPQPYPVPQPYIYPRPWRPYRHEPWITWTNDIPLYKTTCGTDISLDNNAIRFQLRA